MTDDQPTVPDVPATPDARPDDDAAAPPDAPTRPIERMTPAAPATSDAPTAPIVPTPGTPAAPAAASTPDTTATSTVSPTAGPTVAPAAGPTATQTATAAPSEPERRRPPLRVGTVVWGLVIAVLGVGVIAWALGARIDAQLALVVLLGGAGVALLVGSILSGLRSSRR